MKGAKGAIAIVLCLAGYSVSAQQIAPASTQPIPLASQTGRYVLGAVQSKDGFTTEFLLDTHSGRTWKGGCIKWDSNDKCIVTGLKVVYFGDGTGGEITATPESLPTKPVTLSPNLKGFFGPESAKK
jgi:hypothetical protein